MRARIALATIAVFIAATSMRCFGVSPLVRTPGYAQKWVTYSPMPEYPRAARAHHITGAGVFVMRVEIRTGRVKRVIVAHSTGNSLLDSTASKALSEWRFKPGALPSIKELWPNRPDPFAAEDSFIKIPIRFTM